ncbi:MAG: InlB B-repeat-containing protein [Prevotella sp.]|nr:InlB B-repeat-containing protein [Prevotella sp.]
MQLIDGETGSEGNVMSVNKVVEAGQSVSYTTTVGVVGIHTPVTCRFKYDYNGSEYTIDAVYKNLFEYTLLIKSTGNGSVTYSGATIRNGSKSFTVDRYGSATLSFTPDNGYCIKSVKVNNSDVTSNVSNNKYTISSISKDTNVEVEFEAIPVTTYSLTITSTGQGSVAYSEYSISNTTKSYTVNEGTSVTLTFTPNSGYRIKSVLVNDMDVTPDVSNNKYTVNSISKSTAVNVTFEADVPTSYPLTITATGQGTVNVAYTGISVSNSTKTLDLSIGASATLTFAPSKDYKVSKVTENGVDVTTKVTNNKYTVSNIDKATTVKVTFEELLPTYYQLIYMVDGVVYKTFELASGVAITPEPAPTKEGHTFSGWSEIPQQMPDHDVTITGKFTINTYNLVYMVDGKEYKSIDVNYGSSIQPLANPTKEGYVFSGWSEIPTTMPAKDVVITGSFTRGQYTITYLVDGQTYKSFKLDFEAVITPEELPTKDGYTFSGWSDIPAKMPSHDVTVTGSFTINKYKLVYQIDGQQYKAYEMEYGASITPESAPTKEGYTFTGWSWTPKTMPAENVTIIGSFKVNSYTVVYKVDGVEYLREKVEYGAKILPPAVPQRTGFTFSWNSYPETMPAQSMTISGEYEVASAIDNASASKGTVKTGQDCLYLSGLQPNEHVSIYNLAGELQMAYQASADGDLTITLSTLTQGIYIIKTNHQTFKVTRK